jgi:CDP-glycerol glycerophosphotransferase (TagB/SpsB family)
MIGADFLDALDRLTVVWLRASGEDSAAGQALLRRVMDAGLETVELPAVADPVSPAERTRCEIEVTLLSGMVDEDGYRAAQPGLSFRPGRAAHNFCRRGWHRLDNPSLDFDVWWYWFRYLGLDEGRINPLVHYLLVGRHAGMLPSPPRPPERPASSQESGAVRRVCLYAAYDVDGVVDDYVVAYLQELSRFADVYYLADCVMQPAELQKLDGVTKGAWARRHGMYDFGSFAIMARELVGWDVIDGYDELLLANDSCFLLRPLDQVFESMDSRECDWWGMQATKVGFEGGPGENRVLQEDEVHRVMVTPEWRQMWRLHLSSYFVCLRRPAHQEPDVRRLLNSVVPQRLKNEIITKYEVGLSRVLIHAGHRFATFVEGLHPFHPLYTSDYFDLLDHGFPLLKRNFLSENTQDVPDLAHWKERIAAAVPEADLEMFERNLLRVAPDDHLRRSFAIVTRDDGSVDAHAMWTDDEIEHLDARTPTFDHWWAFPVCAYDHTLAGNARAVFEEVRDDPSVKKVVLTRSRKLGLDGENVVEVPLLSPEGQHYALRCGQVFIKHAPLLNVPYPLDPRRHNFVNLWHGIPLKRFGFASLEPADDLFEEANVACRSVVTSSKVDTLAMTAAFHPLRYENMWMTGLPRIDFVNRPPDRLPGDLVAQQQELADLVAGRRLVMLLPTFKRDQGDAYYRFPAEEIEWLAQWQERHGAVLGVREHMADEAHTYSQMLAPLNPVLLTPRRFPDLEVLYGAAEALVSDYSSCLVDFLVTGKPVVSFAYDLDRYHRQERGLFYELSEVLPGPLCRTFDELAEALDGVFDEPTPEQREDYEWKRRFFFAHLDDQNARRVVQRVRELYVPH